MTLLSGWHGRTLTDAEAERDADWDAWVDAALRNAGDHSIALAEHTGRALRLVEEAGDE